MKRKFAVISGGESVDYVVCDGCKKAIPEREAYAICGYYLCNDCDGELDDDDVTPVAPGEEQSEHEWGDDPVTAATAMELGLTPNYVGWLLFEADDEDYDKKPQLINAYVLADATYTRLMHEMIETGQVDEDEYDDLIGSDECGVQVFDQEVETT